MVNKIPCSVVSYGYNEHNLENPISSIVMWMRGNKSKKTMSRKKRKEKMRNGGGGYNRMTYETFLEHKNTVLILLFLDWQQLLWAWLKGFPIERAAEVFIA